MTLRLIGVDPNSPNNGSPAVWVDAAAAEIVIRGWKIVDEATMADIRATGPIPDHETALRFPMRLAQLLTEAIGGRGTDLV